MNITETSKNVFLAYADDAGNWSGSVPVGGNVGGGASERGNLTQLKQAGLINTYNDEGNTWIVFTDAGKEYAAQNGISI